LLYWRQAGANVEWWQFALLGAAGGLLVEVLAIFRWGAAWQQARRTKTGRRQAKPPKLRAYVDVPAHAWIGFTGWFLFLLPP
jgi:hypothetical protein